MRLGSVRGDNKLEEEGVRAEMWPPQGDQGITKPLRLTVFAGHESDPFSLLGTSKALQERLASVPQMT